MLDDRKGDGFCGLVQVVHDVVVLFGRDVDLVDHGDLVANTQAPGL